MRLFLSSCVHPDTSVLQFCPPLCQTYLSDRKSLLAPRGRSCPVFSLFKLRPVQPDSVLQTEPNIQLVACYWARVCSRLDLFGPIMCRSFCWSNEAHRFYSSGTVLHIAFQQLFKVWFVLRWWVRSVRLWIATFNLQNNNKAKSSPSRAGILTSEVHV